MNDTEPFIELESNVRAYCRTFSTVFQKAKGSIIHDERGRRYIDFFAGASALNYGHNNDFIKEKLIEYLQSDAIVHALDFYTTAKRTFLADFQHFILEPRRLSYKFQFCGPTGANAIEAALKLARKVKQRTGIFSFMGGYHGVSLGALSATSHRYYREAAGLPLGHVTFIPFPSGVMDSVDSIEYMEKVLEDERSGIEKPAAVLFETIQAEGGVNVAPLSWLQRLAEFCQRQDILLICDDIQVGCGRAGNFFSYEKAEIQPDIVVLSKSLSGYGLPLSMLLLKPELDVWKPGEHNGTFRGNQLAFVTASAALKYREVFDLEAKALGNERMLAEFLEREIASLDPRIQVRGRGLIWGVDLSRLGRVRLENEISQKCFDAGLLIERAGKGGSVFKFLPPLNIEPELLQEGCDIFRNVLHKTLAGVCPERVLA
jgi:diaminobutyrate-2-oxoglutarate transaminase